VERKPRELPEEIVSLINEREEARKARDWAKSDSMRERLRELGVEIMDTPEGPKWKIMRAGVGR
jgi:cysteinyl-tRNA synthetase